jgi:hypothetical protein
VTDYPFRDKDPGLEESTRLAEKKYGSRPAVTLSFSPVELAVMSGFVSIMWEDSEGFSGAFPSLVSSIKTKIDLALLVLAPLMEDET